MGDLKCQALKHKSLELLKVFYFQNEFKYKFGPDGFNEVLAYKDKSNIFFPKTFKVFKKILKFKNLKLKKHARTNSKIKNQSLKIYKKIQDEQNVNDALQEATVLDRVSVLKKKGIWSRDALPKVLEPSRSKVYWDYLINEIEWLSIDRINRLNWKISAAKIIAESAKTYVHIKDEIKTLEFIQFQEEARLHCSKIAKMIKNWFKEKQNNYNDYSNIATKVYENSSMDLCQLWLSKSLINCDSVDDDVEFLCKSDSDSLCSFDSKSHSSVMFSEENLCFKDMSLNFSESNSPSENFIEEINWLESDMNMNEVEMKSSFENEINELKILSQMPLEKIIDENYFNVEFFDTKSVIYSDIDMESVLTDISQEPNDSLVMTGNKQCFIISQGEKIQDVLNASYTEMLSSTSGILEEILKNESLNRNIKILYELIKIKCSFSMVSSLQVGDDRFMISVLLGFMSNKYNSLHPELIITTTSQIYEWQILLSKLFPLNKIIIFDSYLSLNDANEVLRNFENLESLICIISYESLSTPFYLTSVKWDNIIYDQIDKLCENSTNIPENIFLNDAKIMGVKIGLISQDTNFLGQISSGNIFLRLLYSSFEVDELMNEVTQRKSEKILTVLLNHCIPLQKVYHFENSCHLVLCELTPFQNSLHKHTLNKLQKSLESNNLLNIIEAICQDIQLSQHPFCYECSDNEEAEIFHSLCKNYHNDLCSTYFLSNNDILSIYLPRKMHIALSSFKEDKYKKVSNYILPHNLLDSVAFGFTKYERLQMKNLLISTSNIDYSLNKVSTYLTDIDDEQSINQNNLIDSDSHCIFEKKEFLSATDIDNLISELNIFPGNQSSHVIKKNFIMDYELQVCDKEKDLQMSLTLAARRSKTKFKSRLASISKENEKYSVYLDCSDICYLAGSKFLLIDFDYFQSESNCLKNLTTISKKYFENTSFRMVQPKVVSRPPRLISNYKLKFTDNSENKLVHSISTLFQEYLSETPKINTKLFNVKKDELNLSGKLKTLNSMLLRISTDPLMKSCIIMSHSFELLNLIEALIYINNNYGTFIKFRLNSCHEENEVLFFSLVEKFNRVQMRNKKSILLLHSRINYQLITHINIQSCSIIIADTHWQTDSDQLIFKLINRCSLNSLWSAESGILSIYRLCCLETLEQYFLTNDLSFLYESSFNHRNDIISTSSAIVCKQSILKCFLDKLLSPLKEKLLSGLSINEFQSAIQRKSKLMKLPRESIEDLFNSFENPYDLLQLCTYKSAKRALTNNFKNLSEYSKNQLLRERKSNQLNIGKIDITFKEALLNWEVNRANRQNKLKHLLNFTDDNNLLFYDPKYFLFKDELIWMPLDLDENIRMVQSEVSDKYVLEPLKDTDLSLYLIPTKNYVTKSNYKKWDEKHLSCTAKEELTLSQSNYIDTEKVKKRKLPTEFQIGELASFSLNHQKKRKIFTNRRYFTENESDNGNNQCNLKARYKIEKKSDSEIPVLDTKDISDIKRLSPIVCEALGVESQYPVNQHIQNNVGTVSDAGKSNSIILYATDNSTKISLQRPFYCKEGLKTLKIKRQLSTGALTNLQSKTNVLTGSNLPNYALPQRPAHQRGQLFINTKLGSSSESNTQSNGESEYEKLPEWNIHEEAVLYQNISHYQDHQFSTNVSEKSNSLPNFKICEHYLNFYSITNTHRSNEMCKIHFTKLQMGFLNQNKGENSLSRINRNSNITNSNGVLRVRTVNETRPIIGGVTGRKLKIKMKNSIGTYGTSIFGSSQAMTNKIKMFQSFLNDRKVNLTKTNQIVNSCLNSFDSKTTMTFKMLDEVVNTSKLPSLLPNHSQTIKKNATHISALAEHNIESDKIFTPAMLIQRREEIDKESESNNRQSLTPASYRNCFESNTINSSNHSLNHIRRNPSANMSNPQNLYSLQAPSSNQVITRTRYNVPLNRQVSGTTVIHQQNSNQNPIMAPNVASSQNQTSNLGSRSQAVQFQIQHSRNQLPRKTSNQQVIQRLYSGSMHNFPSLRQNHIMNRGSTAFVRPIIPTVVNQSNSQNTTTNSSIITVFPNSHDQSNNGIGRTIERNSNFNLSGHLKGSNVRTNIGTMASNSRGNLNQIPRMLHVNQINRNNLNINKTNNQEQ